MRGLTVAGVLWVVIALGGCAVRDTIRRYKVAKPEPTHRLLGALVPRGQQTWFFKLVGPNEALARQSEAFVSLIKSVRFSDDAAAPPQWTLPAGWTQKAGTGFRFATIEIASDREPLELAVTQLPFPGGDRAEYVLSNVNLWRQQVGLKPLDLAQLASATTQLPLAGAGEVTATLVDVVGYAARGGGHGKVAASPHADTTAREIPLRYEVPAGWQPGQLVTSRGGVQVRRQAAFDVRQADKQVEITVTSLPAGANTLLSNVNRWRRQIGLEDVSEEQLGRDTTKISLGEVPGDYVQLQGSRETILGVVAVRDGMTWFIKLQGDRELAAREKERFESFAKSIRFGP